MNNRNDIYHAATLLLVVLALVAVLCTGFGKPDEKTVTPRTVTVSGRGEVSAEPDVARFTVSATFTEDTSEMARIRTSDMINTAVDMLTALGIEQSGIETGYISVYPSTRWDSEKQEEILIGQKATQSIEVTCHDISIIGDCYDSLMSLNGISISSVTLDRSDKSGQYSEARRLAAEDAARKAGDYAEALGLSLGDPLTVNDGSTSAVPLYRSMNMVYAASADMSAEGGSVEYHAGDITVSSSVNVTFEMM